jgi:VCBS repeat protein/FG-GAP repeat protein
MKSPNLLLPTCALLVGLTSCGSTVPHERVEPSRAPADPAANVPHTPRADVTFVSDVDGDGHPDLVVSDPGTAPGGKDRFVARLRSSRDGRVLRRYAAPDMDVWREPVLATVGDLDGDGVDDFALGCRSANPSGLDAAGSVLLISTAKGVVLVRIDGSRAVEQFGQSIAPAGDIDGDGKPDVLVGSLSSNIVRVCSGSDGSVLQAWEESAAGAQFGMSVAGGRDVTGDGVPDFVIGAPEPGVASGRAEGRGTGYVDVHPGGDDGGGAALSGDTHGARFGATVQVGGDVDGDGAADLIIGVPGVTYGGRKWCGRITCVSARSGRVLWSLDGERENDRLGTAVAICADLNRDGVADIVVGMPWHGVGQGQEVGGFGIVSGANGRLIRVRDGTTWFARRGDRVVCAGGKSGMTAILSPGANTLEVFRLPSSETLFTVPLTD